MLVYDEDKLLGKGGFGQVFSGRLNNTPVAVKKVPLRRCFWSEFALHGELDHPSIVKLLDVQVYNKHFFLALELMEHGDVPDFIEKNGALDTPTIIKFAKDIMAGLGYLHDQGILHRDIKPENIVINKNMRAKITDFGLACKDTNEPRSTKVGSKGYLAPELALSFAQNTGKYNYTQFTDLYALGLTLLAMTLGTNPYDSSSLESSANGKHRKLPETTPPELGKVISACLMHNPNNRITAQYGAQALAILSPDTETVILAAVHGNIHLIHYAAKINWVYLVKKLLQYNPELVHIKDSDNQTPLLWAAARGYDELVTFLIEQGAEVNEPTLKARNDDPEHNLSPLDWALRGGHRSCISTLLMAGAIANQVPTTIKDKSIIKIIIEGNLELIQTLLQCNPIFQNKIDRYGLTLLHYAACVGQTKIARYLIATGAEITQATANITVAGVAYRKMTALEVALIYSRDSMVLLLLDAGAEIPSTKKTKSHAIHVAASNGRFDLIKKLVQHNPDLVHSKDACNQTPLLWAAGSGYDDIVAFLIAQGADVNEPTQAVDNNHSPLDWAIKGKHAGCIALLLRAGAKANQRHKEYETELAKNRFLLFNAPGKMTLRKTEQESGHEHPPSYQNPIH